MGSTKTSTQQQSQSNSNYTNTSTPTQSAQVTAFRNGLLPQISSLIAGANQPLYGQAAYASQLSNLNQLANSSINTLQNRIASTGGNLNSGAYAGGVSGILQNRNSNLSNYLMQIPGLNQQYKSSALTSAINLGNAVGASMPTTTTQSGSGSQSGSSDSTTVQSQSPLSTIMSLAGAALGGGLTSGSGLIGQIMGKSPSIFGSGSAATSAVPYGTPYGPSLDQAGLYPGYNYNPLGAFGGGIV